MSNYDDGRGVQDAPLSRDSGGDTARYSGRASGCSAADAANGYQQQWAIRPKRV